MSSKRRTLPWPATDAGNDHPFVKRLRYAYATGKYSNVLVRVSPGGKEFTFLLFPLVIQSEYFRRRLEAIWGDERNGSTVTIDVTDFRHGADNMRLVQDFCCGVLDENNICTTNIVKLLATSEFLEMKCLKQRLWRYLERHVLDSRETSFKVLATFENTNLPGINVDHTQNDCLFGRCQKVFLHPLEEVLKGKPSVCYNVVDLLRAAKRLPTCVAERIYQSLVAEQCRFNTNFFVMYFRRGSAKAKDYKTTQDCRLLVTSPRQRTHSLQIRPLEITFFPKTDDLVRWMEDLKYMLPTLSDRSLLILYLTELLHPPVVNSNVELNFLSGLLIEAAALATLLDTNRIAPGLVEQISDLEGMVCDGLHQVLKSPRQLDQLQMLLLKFKFATLLGIVKRFQRFYADLLSILSLAKILDAALLMHLRKGSFTANQIFLIYQELPNEARPSHGELYDQCQSFMGDSSSQESLQNEQSDEEEPNERQRTPEVSLQSELPETADLGEAYNRALQVDEHRCSHQEELQNLRGELRSVIDNKILIETERDSLSEGKRLAETARDALQKSNKNLRLELCSMIGDLRSMHDKKVLAETAKDSMMEGKRLVESERDALQVNKGLIEAQRDEMCRGLDEEKQRTTCQICFEQRRDALCLPCMHFLYCFKCLQEHHDRQGKTCPACQGLASGVLKCNLSA